MTIDNKGVNTWQRNSVKSMKAYPEEPPRKIMDAVESGMAKSKAVWVNLIASCRIAGVAVPISHFWFCSA